MNNFKMGDKVRIIKRDASNATGFHDFNRVDGDVGKVGYIGIVLHDGTYSVHEDLETAQRGSIVRYYGYFPPEHLVLVSEFDSTVRFILQYELDEDPFETFATMKEVETRIKELSERSNLKRESIRVYEVAKTLEVKLETRIIFGETKVKIEEAPKVAKKRGRPVKFQCPDCSFKGKSKGSLGQHRRFSHQAK